MSPDPLPLAAASARLRRKPGRPTTNGRPRTPQEKAKAAATRQARKTATATAVPPRLLDLELSAQYLGLSPWTVRDLEAAGILARVRVPLPNDGELRKLLFDRVDLDALVEQWKGDGR